MNKCDLPFINLFPNEKCFSIPIIGSIFCFIINICNTMQSIDLNPESSIESEESSGRIKPKRNFWHNQWICSKRQKLENRKPFTYKPSYL